MSFKNNNANDLYRRRLTDISGDSKLSNSEETYLSFVEYSQSNGNIQSATNGKVILKPIVDNFKEKCRNERMKKLLRINQMGNRNIVRNFNEFRTIIKM